MHGFIFDSAEFHLAFWSLSFRRSFCYSLLVVRSFGYRVNVGLRQEWRLKRELWVHAVMSSSVPVLSLLNTAEWPERVGTLRLLSQSCSRAPMYYFLQWENSHVPSEAGAASWLRCPGPLASVLTAWCSLWCSPSLRPTGIRDWKNAASRSLHWHQEDSRSLPQPNCSHHVPNCLRNSALCAADVKWTWSDPGFSSFEFIRISEFICNCV